MRGTGHVTQCVDDWAVILEDLGSIPKMGLWRHTDLSSWPLKKQKLGNQHYKLTLPLCQLQPQVGYMTSYPKITGWTLDQMKGFVQCLLKFKYSHAAHRSFCQTACLLICLVCMCVQGDTDAEVRGQLAWVSFASSCMIRGTELKSSALVEGTLTCWAIHPPTHPGMNFIFLFNVPCVYMFLRMCGCMFIYVHMCVNGWCWGLTITLPPGSLRQGISSKPRACWSGPSHYPACSGDPLTPSFVARIPGGPSSILPTQHFCGFLGIWIPITT